MSVERTQGQEPFVRIVKRDGAPFKSKVLARALAIVLALVSSLKDRPLDEKTVVFGEVGLSGEVRSVPMAEQRVSEALKLGFEACILPQINLDKMKKTDPGIRLLGVRTVQDAIALL